MLFMPNLRVNTKLIFYLIVQDITSFQVDSLPDIDNSDSLQLQYFLHLVVLVDSMVLWSCLKRLFQFFWPKMIELFIKLRYQMKGCTINLWNRWYFYGPDDIGMTRAALTCTDMANT